MGHEGGGMDHVGVGWVMMIKLLVLQGFYPGNQN